MLPLFEAAKRYADAIRFDERLRLPLIMRFVTLSFMFRHAIDIFIFCR